MAAVVQKSQNDAALAAREAASYAPPPLTISPAADAPVVAVIGDSSIIDTAAGVPADGRWTALLGESLDTEVLPLALPGAGYATDGDDGDVFESVIDQVPEDAASVVFVGGAADVDVSKISLARAASETYAAAAERAPDAEFVVVGPFFRPQGVSASELTDLLNALRGAAAIADMRFIDPASADWVGSGATLDGLSADEARTVAARLSALLEPEAD